MWDSKADTLGFQVNEHDGVEYTQMDITKKEASVFDFLGTAAPLIVNSVERTQDQRRKVLLAKCC